MINIYGDKLDNSLSNLKLVVNKSDNNPYKDRVNIATNLDTDAKSFYYSISSAGKDLDINPGSISLILNEKKKELNQRKIIIGILFLTIIIKKEWLIFLEIKQRNP